MPDLERIQKLTPGTLSQQWTEDGAVVDPGTVTIGITKADGTVLVAAGHGDVRDRVQPADVQSSRRRIPRRSTSSR
jgi:hypothetical protein